jgi:predicted DNA-binding transcriptional regulator YafY
MTQLVRLLTLKSLLERRRYRPPVSELADRFGVCQRTVLRDLAVLGEVGADKGIPYHPRRVVAEGLFGLDGVSDC